MVRANVPDAGAAQLRRLRHLMCGRDGRGLQGRDEHLERRGVVVFVPADLRVPAVALGGLAVKDILGPRASCGPRRPKEYPKRAGRTDRGPSDMRKRKEEKFHHTTGHLHPWFQTG
jgi:hypothetical protein